MLLQLFTLPLSQRLLQEDAKKMKSKQRSKMQPKMGKLGMDYQMMHDAFFKYQSKPRMSRMGDLYYEGKEFEAKARCPSCPRGLGVAGLRIPCTSSSKPHMGNLHFGGCGAQPLAVQQGAGL